jgi:hypothetical protein
MTQIEFFPISSSGNTTLNIQSPILNFRKAAQTVFSPILDFRKTTQNVFGPILNIRN